MATSNMDLQKALTIAAAIIGLLIVSRVGLAVISRYRKNLLKGSDQTTGLWTLDDLRDMKDSGQLTDQEYQVLRQRMVHKTLDSTGPAKPKQNPPAGPNDNRRRGHLF